jgi:hypothetical protein
MDFSTDYTKRHGYRFSKTISFIKKHIDTKDTILDLGVRNPFSEIMEKEGYKVINTEGEDLDLYPKFIEKTSIEVLTAFEIFEHLLNPFNILLKTKAKKLVATVPLKLWFAPTYRNQSDPMDNHFHEFEDWQFDWLLKKTGWNIIDREKWVSPTKINGIRPLLRNFTPRHYAVYAERK